MLAWRIGMETFKTETWKYPGMLIVGEGTDGAGKTTQLSLLANYLQSKGFGVILTEWNSSKLASKTIKKAKKMRELTPRTFSIVHSLDLSSRLSTIIRPALESGMVVIADRYVYTAFARDVARGNDPIWVRNLYSFAPKPDVAFLFRVPIDISLQRISLTHVPNFYESGMDMGFSNDPMESYKIFQSKILDEYDKMVPEFGLVQIDGRKQIALTQVEVRHIVTKLLKEKFGSRKIKGISKPKLKFPNGVHPGDGTLGESGIRSLT